MSDRCPTVRQRPTVRQSDSSDSCPTVITRVSCHTPLRQLRQLRQGSDSSDSSPTAPTAPLLGWLHLIGMPLDLVEVHPSRKVSLDKCSHQGSAHWQQYALHGAPSIQGSHPRGGVPCAVMGCLPPIGWHTKGDTMFMEVAKKMPHHGATLLTHMTTS